MSGREMEGDNRYRRKKAREARRAGESPSARNATFGASKQRKHVDSQEDHATKLETIRAGKQKVIRENTPKPRPGSRRD
jgi:hypothetical protein